MHTEFNELNIGDVFELDSTAYVWKAEGRDSLVIGLGQNGDLDDGIYGFEDNLEHVEGMPMINLCPFHSMGNSAPTHKIGKDGRELIGKKFVVISTRPDGVPEEDMYHSGLEESNSGQMVIADEVFINEHNELYMEGEAVRLRAIFNQGQGFDHRLNFPKVIGKAIVERTYTVGYFKPLVK